MTAIVEQPVPVAASSDQVAMADYIPITFAIASLALVVAMLIFGVLNHRLAEEFSAILFGFFGLGSAPLQLMPKVTGWRYFATSVVLGISIVLGTGTLFIEVGIWSSGRIAFLLIAAAATGLHLYCLGARSGLLKSSTISLVFAGV